MNLSAYTTCVSEFEIANVRRWRDKRTAPTLIYPFGMRFSEKSMSGTKMLIIEYFQPKITNVQRQNERAGRRWSSTTIRIAECRRTLTSTMSSMLQFIIFNRFFFSVSRGMWQAWLIVRDKWIFNFQYAPHNWIIVNGDIFFLFFGEQLSGSLNWWRVWPMDTIININVVDRCTHYVTV